MYLFHKILILLFGVAISVQAVPPVLNYAGQVAVNGEAFDGNGLFKFALVNDDGTTTYWSNDGTSVEGSEPQASVAVAVNGGLYAVLLGNTAQQGMGAIDPAVFAQHTDAKLRVWFSDGVNGFQQLSPDRPFASVPYAFNSKSSDTALNAETAKTADSANVAMAVQAGAITKQMLGQDVLLDLNQSIKTITRNMLPVSVLSDLNRTITKSMLGNDVLADLNRTVTYNRLASSAIHAISSASLSSITDGKIKIVPFGQNPPTGYFLYHRAKAENLNWEFTPSSFSPGSTLNTTVIYNNRAIRMGREKGFQQNPVLSNWVNLYTVNNTNSQFSTVILNDKVYLIGGMDGGSKSNRFQIFNLTNNSFSEGTPSPVAGQHRTSQVLDGKIFETGGWKVGNEGSRRTFCYDPILDEWTEVSLTNFGRIHSASIVFQNKLWIIGGENNSADKVESYDTSTDNWTIEKSLLKGRKQASCWVFRDFLFVGGGKDVNGTILDSIECYDLRTETWHDWGQLPNPVSSCASFVVGDILHIFDGVGNAGVLSLDLKKSTSTLNDIYIQDLNVSAGNALVQAEVADGSVTASKMADGAITTDKLNEQILKYLKPEITSQPQAQTVYADTNVSFSVTAEGKYLTYQWKKDGVNLTGETNATLNITDAIASLHDGNYSVVVSNDFGSVESDLTEVLVIDAILNGLVGWWKFDEGSGTVAYDSSGNGNDGNLTNGPTWTTGKIGGALSFDGTNDYVKIGSSSVFDLQRISISAWVFSDNYSNSGFIFEKTTNGTVNSQYGLFFENGLRFRNEGADDVSFSISSGGWLFVTSTYDGTKKKLFTNGLERNQVTWTGTIPTSPSGVSAIGGFSETSHENWSNYIFNGLIDDVRIYDRALSAEEVQALYNMGQ